MPLPRVRFTVRRMMVAVAVVAAAISAHRWTEAMRALSGVYWRTSLEWEAAESWHRIGLRDSSSNDRQRHRTAFYAEAMKLKYRRADRYPWLPVAPDPPEPE